MGVLSGLEPKGVFRWFEALAAIPHGSRNTRAVSDWLADFARARGLRFRQDGADNVIIWKDASPGYEDAPTVMLQGHMDMVCEKAPDCEKDMAREGLALFLDGDEIGARGSTLGADDGIAVAMALAVLDDDAIPHGPLECLFTADEEVGMLGAQALDVSDLKARVLLNIDSAQEGVLTVSCAGSARLVCTLPVSRAPFPGTTLRLSVEGLFGGHSGEEIHRGRGNANMLLGRALQTVSRRTGLRLIRAEGGGKDNAIPRRAEALLRVEDPEAARQAAAELESALQNELRFTDPGVRLTLSSAESDELPLTEESSRRILGFLFCVPNGVQVMSPSVPGLVQTSLNLGRLSTEPDRVLARIMVRSGVNSQRDETARRVAALTELLGGSVEIPSAYSAWEYRADSPLRETMVQVFRELYGKEPRVTGLHAGLECGVLTGKLPGLDCISFAPDLENIHTPCERLRIASTQRVWALLLETLRRLR
jgi:dipeptidase D